MPLRINLKDSHLHLTLAPHTLYKPAPFLRCGIFTSIERYKFLAPDIEIGFQTVDYLSENYKPIYQAITVDAAVMPTKDFIEELHELEPGDSLSFQSKIIAHFGEISHKKEFGAHLTFIEQRWQLSKANEKMLRQDFLLITAGRTSAEIPSNCHIIGPKEQLFLEDGCLCNGATFNTLTGPIYLASSSEVMEGSLIRGPFSLDERAQIKMGAKIYGATTVGPDCKVGGEINNVIFESFSNKSHDGFLGNGYISSWCNIGADTNASNLMNDYGTVEVYDYTTRKSVSSGEQFVGLHMGDHSKCGINTMFNTGTAVGVACNVYGPGFFKKHIPSFSFGEPARLFPYRFEKAIEGIESMMARRNRTLSKDERSVLEYLCQHRESF